MTYLPSNDSKDNGRWRTVLLSVVVSGLVSLTIVQIVERFAFNQQAERARKNCRAIEKGFQTLTEIAQQQSFTQETAEGRRRWRFYAEEFDDLVPPEAETCQEKFPKRGTIPFIE